MKKLFLLVLMLSAVISKAQVVHEHTYSPSQEAMVYPLEGVGYRYLASDKNTNKINLYDGNHNLWKSIDAKLPAGCVLQRAMYPSTMLFDLDTAVEVLVFYAKTGPVTGPNVGAQLVDESGSVLNVFDYAHDAKVLPFDSSWKLIISDIGSNSYLWTEVYGLPGKFIAPLKGPNTINNDPVSAVFYPNPMDNLATLEYALPKGEQKGTVLIYNSNGTVIRTYPINQNTGTLMIQRDGLPAGAYYITTSSDGVQSTAQKIIMN